MLVILTIGANLDLSLALIVMSAEQLTAFLEAVESDTSLQEKLSASTDGEIDTQIGSAAVVAIANEAGFTITVGDILRADAQSIMELNDEDLEKVAGGMYDLSMGLGRSKPMDFTDNFPVRQTVCSIVAQRCR